LKKNKILITGGTGFIGYHLAKKCVSLNWIVDSISTKFPSNDKKLKKVRYLKIDISKKKELIKNLSEDYDYVVNLAGYVDHSNKTKTLYSHYNGCKNISEIFLKKKIKKFIQIGSSIEYGRNLSPQKENVESRKTFSIYGKAKLKSTNYLLSLYKKHSFPASVLRLYLVYGPHQDRNRVIPIVIDNALKSKEFDCSSGTQFRDFVYIDDVVNGIIKSLKNKKNNGQIINLGSGKPIMIKDIILKICKIIGSGKPQFGKIKFRKDEINNLYPSITKAKKILKWTPRVKINLGLKKTINYYKKNG
jgi:nucleoside-diphosphate-sugar epimerase